jgi:uncharacterized heparinase superfamily protein
MPITDHLAQRWALYLNSKAARRAARGREVTVFTSQPEPQTIGSQSRGLQLASGNFIFDGHFVHRPGVGIWDIPVPTTGFSDECHGFAWLDDLAAAGDAKARKYAQRWLTGWIERYGDGQGPGWTPDLTGRRLIRWINHAFFVLHSRDEVASDQFYRSLAHQTVFLSRRWQATKAGLPRFEALTGLIYAGLSLEGMQGHAPPAVEALARECEARIDPQGGIPSRNPEELLEIFTLLTWAAEAIGISDLTLDPAHSQAIERIAPTLRALRHSDGGLARFHGGGRGLEGRLDHALAISGVKTRPVGGVAMGYARLNAGRISVIIDAAPPPRGKESSMAHASTLAFELTSGRRPLIVNSGSGVQFGPEWRKVGRATPSHSTLVLDGHSSAELKDKTDDKALLTDAPENVPVEFSQSSEGQRFESAHEGYEASYGLTYVRKLELASDGRSLSGEDMLVTLSKRLERQFDKAMQAAGIAGIPYDIRFILHPDVDAAVDMGGAAVSIALKSGELWVFRGDGKTNISIESAFYLGKSHIKPRATKQIVLSGAAMGYATRIRWSLAKAQDTPIGIRDLERDAMEPVINT